MITHKQLSELYEKEDYLPESNFVLRFPHTGADGMGIVLNHFGGDGSYPIVSRFDKLGNLMEVAIIFDGSDEDDCPIEIDKERLEGEVCVDSGQLIIADPCYILAPGDDD